MARKLTYAQRVAPMEFQQLNAEAKKWASLTLKELKSFLRQENVGVTGELLGMLRWKLKYRDGVVEKVAFQLTKGGIMTEHGVGKGVSKEDVLTNGGKYYRKPKPWLSSAMEQQLPLLADRISKEYADMAIRQVNF